LQRTRMLSIPGNMIMRRSAGFLSLDHPPQHEIDYICELAFFSDRSPTTELESARTVDGTANIESAARDQPLRHYRGDGGLHHRHCVVSEIKETSL